MKRIKQNWRALIAAAIYLAAGTIWILVTGRLVNLLTDEATEIVLIEMIKGVAFVIGSALLVFALAKGAVVRERTDLDDKAVSENRRLLNRVFASLGDAVFFVNPENRTIENCNAAATTIFGYSESELVGSGTEILHVDRRDCERFAAAGDPLLERDGVFRTEYRLRKNDGSLIDCEITVIALSDVIGWRTGVVSVVRDITLAKKAEEEAETHRRELEAILDNVPAIIMRTDHFGIIRMVNRRVDRFGVTPETVIGKTLSEAGLSVGMKQETVDIWNGLNEYVFHEKQPKTRSWTTEIEGREAHFESSVVPELDEHGNVITALGIHRDVTEQENALSSLENTREQLSRAQRLESIGTLAGGVAHDFNNILTAIKGYVFIARGHVGNDNEIAKQINDIESAADRAARLTEQLLLFSRRAPSQFTNVDLNSLVSEMMKMLFRLIGENIELRTELYKGSLFVRADIGKIEQVIMNLVVNARDALNAGGEIRIETSRRRCEEGFVGLSVHDNGDGMDDETESKIFDPFFTTKGRDRGTGLGLSVVHGIVEEHGGHINVESTRGIGTSFHICLPETEAPDKERRKTGQRSVQQHSGSRLLVVEDDDAIRGMLVDALTGAGFTVLPVERFSEAVHVTRQDPDIDLVVADVILPDGLGLHLPDYLELEVPFIFTSGYLEERSELDRVLAAGHHFIQKPFSIPDLMTLVGTILGGNEG